MIYCVTRSIDLFSVIIAPFYHLSLLIQSRTHKWSLFPDLAGSKSAKMPLLYCTCRISPSRGHLSVLLYSLFSCLYYWCHCCTVPVVYLRVVVISPSCYIQLPVLLMPLLYCTCRISPGRSHLSVLLYSAAFITDARSSLQIDTTRKTKLKYCFW